MLESPPTRREKVCWIIFYAFIAVSGAYVIAYPPITIGAPWLTFLWGLMLTTSVVLAVAAVLGRFKWEYSVLTLVISGVAIYAAKVWYYTWHTPSQGAKAALITSLAVLLVMRWFERRELVLRDKEHNDQEPHMTG